MTGTASTPVGPGARDHRRASAARKRCRPTSVTQCASCGRLLGPPRSIGKQDSATDLGVPGRIFPQWLRCTGCGSAGPGLRRGQLRIPQHQPLPAGPGGIRPSALLRLVRRRHDQGQAARHAPPSPRATSSPARMGHLDEFPYVRGCTVAGRAPKAAKPALRMREWRSNIGPDVQIML